jgi:hypothetical protein
LSGLVPERCLSALPAHLLRELVDGEGQGGDTRAAARAQTISGRALRRWGRHAQARGQLTAAVAVIPTQVCCARVI